MKEYEECLENYRTLNKEARDNAIVFFGADWLSNVPVAEIIRDNNSDAVVYNRSIRGARLKESIQFIENSVCELNPIKIFVNIGENDISDENFKPEEFAERYEWLLYEINSKCKCEIYALSLINDDSGEVNNIIKSIAVKHGCQYIDINKCRFSIDHFFSEIRYFLRNKPITFFEAMSF